MGTDGGTDTTIAPHRGLVLGRELDLEAVDAELATVVEGLRRGDLAFVVTAVVRLAPAIGVCLEASGTPPLDGRVTDVAFALADLAAEPSTATWSSGELLAAAVAEATGTLGSVPGRLA